MTSLVHRPATLFPDVFSLLESGWPFTERNTVRVEEYVDDDRYVVRAELPGLDPKHDIDIGVEDGRLLLSAQRQQREQARGHSEFRYGTFTRVLPLPPGVDVDDITARYVDGILEVSMPATKPSARPVHIDVQTDNPAGASTDAPTGDGRTGRDSAG